MPQAQDPMILIGELVKAFNIYTNAGVTHHSNLNNSSKTKHNSSVTDMVGHLTQLITESVKVSIYALKLGHDSLKGHSTTQRRRSGGGRNGEGWRIRRLHPWPLWLKLSLAPSNRSCADGTHDIIERRIRNRNREMVKDPHNSRRKNELIIGHHIPIDICEREWNEKGSL